MRAVVTGGAGFIGSHVVDALLARGDEVHVVDNFATGKRERRPGRSGAARAATSESLSTSSSRSIRPEAVFHLAAQADVRVSVERPDFDASVNVVGTIRVLEAARPIGAQVVFSSTGGAIYGERTTPCARGRRRASRSAPYGTSKLCGEEYLAT